MGILDDLKRHIPDEIIEEAEVKFDLEYNDEDGKYFVIKKGKECCKIEFVNSSNDKTVDIDDAQAKPENHIVYVTDISDKANVDEFQKKLNDMGFENISVEDNDSDSKPEIEEAELNETSNMDVIQKFVDDSFPHNKEEAAEQGIQTWSPVWGSTNLKISKQDNGWALINYATPLMFRDDEGKLYFNTDKYSVTTSKVQNQIKGALEGVDYEEVDEEEIKNVIK